MRCHRSSKPVFAAPTRWRRSSPHSRRVCRRCRSGCYQCGRRRPHRPERRTTDRNLARPGSTAAPCRLSRLRTASTGCARPRLQPVIPPASRCLPTAHRLSSIQSLRTQARRRPASCRLLRAKTPARSIRTTLRRLVFARLQNPPPTRQCWSGRSRRRVAGR